MINTPAKFIDERNMYLNFVEPLLFDSKDKSCHKLIEISKRYEQWRQCLYWCHIFLLELTYSYHINPISICNPTLLFVVKLILLHLHKNLSTLKWTTLSKTKSFKLKKTFKFFKTKLFMMMVQLSTLRLLSIIEMVKLLFNKMSL